MLWFLTGIRDLRLQEKIISYLDLLNPYQTLQISKSQSVFACLLQCLLSHTPVAKILEAAGNHRDN